MLTNYVPKDVIITWGSDHVTGFADGSFVTADRSEDTWSIKVGADGEAVRVRNANKSGTIKLTLLQSSPANDVFASGHRVDERTGQGAKTLQVKDLNGTTLCTAALAWVKKPAAAAYGKEATDREWTLETHELDIFTGGATTVGL
jgi:hypothetical protein